MREELKQLQASVDYALLQNYGFFSQWTRQKGLPQPVPFKLWLCLHAIAVLGCPKL